MGSWAQGLLGSRALGLKGSWGLGLKGSWALGPHHAEELVNPKVRGPKNRN
jgi:hypothetical protein